MLNTQNDQQHQYTIHNLERQLETMNITNSQQMMRMNYYESEHARLVSELENLKANPIEKMDATTGQLKTEAFKLKSQIETMNKESEDLLELLTDQDLKLKDYKKRLRSFGDQQVSDED